MKKNRTTGGLGWNIRGVLLFAVVAASLVTTSEAKLFNWFNKEKIANKGVDTGTKQALETVLLLQSQKKITEAANKLDQLATENKLLSDFSAVDQSVKMIAGFAKTEDQNVDHYATFKDGLEKELKRNGFDLSYDQLRSGTRARAPRPTGQDSSSAPSIEQIIATAVNETIKRLSQTGSLSLRWLTVRDGATFLGNATFKENTTLGDDDADIVTIHAATLINTTGAAATTIGNGTSTVKVDTANTNVATHVEVNGSSVPIGLRIIRGTIDGISPTGISEGQGFTFSVVGAGHYRITFDSAFTDIPSVVATTIDSSNTIVRVDSLTTSSVDFKSFGVDGTTATPSEFCFIAMGPTGA